MVTTTVGPGVRLTPQQPHGHALPAAPEAPGLVRRRLHDDLDPLLETPLGVVVGMPGTGKTTAVAHWARERCDEVAWCRAAPGTDTVGLVSSIAVRERPPVIVVDDFHHTMTRTECAMIEELLLGSAARLVVLSRTMPPFNLARSELPCTVVQAATLRFRPEETAELFRRTYDAPLGEADARHLTHHTHGWPAAIRLFHHALDGAGEQTRRRAVAALPEATTYVEHYLTTEVLAGLDERDLDLLRRTSVLDPLSGEHCDALLGAHDSERRLRAVCRTGLVTEESAAFRLHPVVRSHLRAQLRAEVGSAGMGLLERRCARLQEEGGSPEPETDRAGPEGPPGRGTTYERDMSRLLARERRP
jgi:ATP/maltotriose-dependent transcriptional regulator MalT